MRKQWNISLMVLFILLACSLLGLLTLHFVENMFAQSAQIFGYYKSYYLSKAGVELSLTQLKNRGVWFSLQIDSGYDIVRENFVSSGTYFFESSIVGRSSLLSRSVVQMSWCEIPFVLSTGESLVVPVFFDNFTGSIFDSFQPSIVYKNAGYLLQDTEVIGTDHQGLVSVGILVSSGTDLYQTGVYFTTWDFGTPRFFNGFSSKVQGVFASLEDFELLDWKNNTALQNYLVVANKSDHKLSFCLAIQGWQLPTEQYLIKSFGMYGNQKIGLEAVYKQPIPSYLIESSLGE